MTIKQLKEAIKDIPNDCRVKVYDIDYDVDYNAKLLEINKEETEILILFDHDY